MAIGAVVLAACSGGGMENQSEGPSFDSGRLAQGETFSVTFQESGTEYYCTVHGTAMQGRVTVDPDAERSGTVNVSMEDTSFEPRQITVQPGTEVVWTNDDPVEHTVTSGNPSSGGTNPGY